MDVSDAPAEVVALSGVGADDDEAFRALVERHSRRVFRLAFRITGNEQDAEDVVQESFLRAYRQLNRFEGRARFGTWLYRIVANCAVDLMRARKTGDPLTNVERGLTDPGFITSAPGPERLAESAELNQRIAAAMRDLSPLERAAFALRHHEGRSIKEIGQMLNLGTSAAKHAVFRAVKKLRSELRPVTCTSRKTT